MSILSTVYLVLVLWYNTGESSADLVPADHCVAVEKAFAGEGEVELHFKEDLGGVRVTGAWCIKIP